MSSFAARWMATTQRHYAPRARSHLASYMQRMHCDEFGKRDLAKINDTRSEVDKPHGPQSRRSYRLEDPKVSCLMHNSKESQVKNMSQKRQEPNYTHKNDTSLSNNFDNDEQVTVSSDEESDEQNLSDHSTSKSPNRSIPFSPEKIYNRIEDRRKAKIWENSIRKLQQKSTNSSRSWILYAILALVVVLVSVIYFNGNQTEDTSNIKTVFKNIEDVKTKFHNQDSYIWDEIWSGINEVKTRTPKVPSIMLLFANETHTMNCLASALACLSIGVLGGNSSLNLNPQDFGNDPGNIIHTLKDHLTKKAVIIRDVLNINAEAIKALHDLCDRTNPLIEEVIYIITMQTKNYKSSQQKMAFVEKQLYHKLSKNIDNDVLMALVTRITDAAIISVQPEPNLRICPTCEEEKCALL